MLTGFFNLDEDVRCNLLSSRRDYRFIATPSPSLIQLEQNAFQLQTGAST